MKLKQYKKLTNVNALGKEKEKLRSCFNLYTRLRDMQKDANGLIFYYCIACGRETDVILFSDRSIYNGRHHHASHYFNTDKYPSVEFDEDNVNLSCAQCNRRLHGNKDAYEINLRKKIGDERFDALVFRKNQIWKPGILEIEDLIRVYKHKAKTEAERLRIKV